MLRAGLRRAGAAPRAAAAKAFGTAGSPTCGIAYDEGNIFSKIVAGEVPCFKLFETGGITCCRWQCGYYLHSGGTLYKSR